MSKVTTNAGKKITKVINNNSVEESSDNKKTKDQTKNKKSNVFPLKDTKFKIQQNEFFEKIKKVIKMNSTGCFLSTVVAENNELITGKMLDEMKKYYHSKLWSKIVGTDTQSSMAIIRKVFAHHGFELISKEFKNGEIRGYKYYAIKIVDEI